MKLMYAFGRRESYPSYRQKGCNTEIIKIDFIGAGEEFELILNWNFRSGPPSSAAGYIRKAPVATRFPLHCGRTS